MRDNEGGSEGGRKGGMKGGNDGGREGGGATKTPIPHTGVFGPDGLEEPWTKNP